MRPLCWTTALVLMAASCKGETAPEARPDPAASGAAAASGSAATDPTGAAAPAGAYGAESPEVAKTLATLHAQQLKARPTTAVVLGLHEFDGLLPAYDKTGLKAEVDRVNAVIAQLEKYKRDQMSAAQWVDREVLLNATRSRAFELLHLNNPKRNPMSYMDPLNLVPYISRDYAPVEQRIAAIIDIAEATPGYLQDAQENLEPKLPRTFVATALLQARGMVTFVKQDVPAALDAASPEQKAKLQKSLDRMAGALAGYVSFLEEREKEATDEFALGEARFLAMLQQTQGLRINIADLRAVAQADLDRNYAALEAAAKKIDPTKSVAEVVAMVVADKPAADKILEVATQQSTEMRKFLVDKDIVSIPFEDKALLRESPPFMRWNAAFLDGAGPFEKGALPSFYYISPPDPSWPEAEQRAYIPGTTDLLFITIHEVWPGHFLHSLQLKTSDSDIVRTNWNYAMGEGWAHYTEEMMWNQGVSDDERVHVGQLMNALLRNVRFVSAIGLHTGQMSVEASEKLFADKAFQDPGNARQQAVRGTFDPMYLSYTVGKLMIIKLRDDYRAKLEKEGKPFVLKDFHDAFLSYGAAPVPVIREQMLGPDAGPAL